MKDIKTYLMNESSSNYFELNIHEREALATLVGIICGDLGEDEEIKFYKSFYDSLSNEEKDRLGMLHDFLEDTETYKKVNRNNIKGDIPLIKKIYAWMVDNDALQEQWDLIDAFEKIIS